MRYKNFRIIGLSVACAVGGTAYARQLTAEEAFGKVPAELKGGNTRSSGALLYTAAAEGRNVAYVFPAYGGKGYVVAGADDLLPAVLGYSDKAGFDSGSMPPAMKYWLEEYGRQLAYAEAHGGVAASVRQGANQSPIAPLCEAQWSQSRPFNDDCPSINGKKTPAGCTATAMAQVMYAHKWPISGTGTNSYLSGSSREKMEFDFGSTVFDWGNMLPSYSTGYTEAQAAAVAKLVAACGNAALMSYGASASGAYPYDAVYGMVNFLGYDRSILMLERDYYTSQTWDDIVYSELAEGRPVIYGGYDSNYQNGHTFIVDGYGGDGYYHLNWGWGGTSDGYFLLTALDPAEQGTGGSGSGYNYRQDAIINIMPAKEGSEYGLEVMWYGPFAPVNMAYTPGGTVEFTTGSNGYFEAFTLENVTTQAGVKLVPAGGGEAVFYPAGEFEFPSHYGIYESTVYYNLSIPVANFPKDGSYTVTPAYMHNGRIEDMAVKVGEAKSVVMTCSTRGVKFEMPDVSRTLTADNVSVVNKLYSGKPCTVKADIHNSGEEYLGMVKAGFENSEGDVRTWLDWVPVNITDGATVSVTFAGVLNSYNSTLPAGKYKLNIFDESGQSICAAPPTVTVLEAPVGNPVAEITLGVTNSLSGDGSDLNPYLIGDEMDFEVKVDVTSGLFEDTVALYAYYNNDNTDLDFSNGSVSYKDFFVGPGESETAIYKLDTSGFEQDRTAYIRAYGWKSDWSGALTGWMGRRVYVKRTTSGVDGIEAGKHVSAIEVYSLTGVRMLTVNGADPDMSGLAPGPYVVVVKTDSGIERRKIIKK